MSYLESHTEDDCDRCLKPVGKRKLYKLPFIYLDRNDGVHDDVSWRYGYPVGFGYRQYYACKKCYDIQIRILRGKKK
jgi:hypothetical protein